MEFTLIKCGFGIMEFKPRCSKEGEQQCDGCDIYYCENHIKKEDHNCTSLTKDQKK